MRILVADDELIGRKFMIGVLSKYGNCDSAEDGLETIQAYHKAIMENDPYTLISLDIMMPKVDGIKVLKAIRDFEKQCDISQEKQVKVIMTTALSDTQLVHKSFEYGCQAYAGKPVDVQKIKNVLEKLGLPAKKDN